MDDSKLANSFFYFEKLKRDT